MDTPTLDPARTAHMRKQHLLEHGTPDQQRRALVAEILCAFQHPEKWPMTDDERIQLLRKVYVLAQHADETERACHIHPE